MNIDFDKLTDEQKNKILNIISPTQQTTDDFINEVVNAHRYDTVLVAPVSIPEMYATHRKIDAAIDSLNGYMLNPNEWEDKEAVYALMKADPFTNDNGDYTDKKFEVIAYFLDGCIGWEQIDKIFNALGWHDHNRVEDLTLERLVDDIYKCLCQLEEEYLRLDRDERSVLRNDDDSGTHYNKVVESYCGPCSCIRCSIIQYNTTWEFGLEFVYGSESSRSWEWPSLYEKKEEKKVFTFDTPEFWFELDTELTAYREAWTSESHDAVEVFASDDKYVLLNDPHQEYKDYHTIISAITDFFTYNDNDVVIDSEHIFTQIIRPYYHPEWAWPQTVWKGKSKYFTYGSSQYYVTVDSELTDKDSETQITVINLDHDFRMYLNDKGESCY